MMGEDMMMEIIFKLIGPDEFWAMSITCKSLLKLYRKNMGLLGVYLNYKPNSDQIRTLKQINSLKSQYIYVNLPMSSGKTALALIYCLERIKELQGSAIIYATQKVVETFKIEIEKLTRGKNLPVPIVVYDSKGGTTFPASSLVLSSRNCRIPADFVPNLHTVVIDEAHTGTLSLLHNRLLRVNKFILMSAAAPTYDTNGNFLSLGVPISVVGHLSTDEMRLPTVNHHLYCTEPRNCHTKVPTNNFKLVVDKLLNDNKLDYCEGYTRQGTYLLADILASVTGRTFVLCYDKSGSEKFWFDHNMKYKVYEDQLQTNGMLKQKHVETMDLRMPIFEQLGMIYVNSLGEIMAHPEQKTFVGDMSRFSEGVNLNMFKNLILICGRCSPERLRQSVGRIVRTNNRNSEVNVYYITDSIEVVAMSIVSRELMADYLNHMGTKALNVATKRNVFYKPGMTPHETIVLSCKSAKPDKSVDFVQKNNAFGAFNGYELLNAIKAR